jgi:hypothetical protein
LTNDSRGLASADEKTRKRVASEGGSAPHDERGLEAADQETKERVASEGGKSPHKGGRDNGYKVSGREDGYEEKEGRDEGY